MYTSVPCLRESALCQARGTAHTGSVLFIQRFDSALRLNVHGHLLSLDGVYVRDGSGAGDAGALVFHELAEPSAADVAKVARRTATRLVLVLKKQGREVDPELGEVDVTADGADDPDSALAACHAAAAAGTDLFGERAGSPALRLVDPSLARPQRARRHRARRKCSEPATPSIEPRRTSPPSPAVLHRPAPQASPTRRPRAACPKRALRRACLSTGAHPSPPHLVRERPRAARRCAFSCCREHRSDAAAVGNPLGREGDALVYANSGAVRSTWTCCGVRGALAPRRTTGGRLNHSRALDLIELDAAGLRVLACVR
jgi:hypothetical protein